MQLQLLWFLCMVWWKEVVILCFHLVILLLFPSSSVLGEKIKCQKLWKIKFFFISFPLPPHLFSSSDTIRNNSLFPLNQSLNFLLSTSTLFLYSLWLKIQKEKIYINTLTSRVEIMNCLVSVYILLTGHLLGYKFFPFLWR